MTNSERFSSDSDAGSYHHFPPAIIEAFKNSSVDLPAIYARAKEQEGEFTLALQIIAEKFRQQGEEGATFKRGVLVGMFATLELLRFEGQIEQLAALLELPPYIDEFHTQTDPPLSA